MTHRIFAYLLLFALALTVASQVTSAQSVWADRSPHRSAFVTVNGVKLHYLDWGGKGEALLFLGGLNTTAHVFDDIAPRFTDRFRVLALTRRGMGQSDKPTTGYDTDMLVADTVAFLDTLKINRVNLAGFSIAGVELTRFAALYPNRVNKLIYLDATPIHTRGEALPVPEKTPTPEPFRPATSARGTLSVKIKFQPASSEVPKGYLLDSGQAYGDRGNGYAYGWETDNSANARKSNSGTSPDPLYDSTIFMRKQYDDLKWEIAVPSDVYQVRVVMGTPNLFTAAYAIEIEGVMTVDDDPLPTSPWVEGVATVIVEDGKLTINSVKGSDRNNLCFVEIYSVGRSPDRLRTQFAPKLPGAMEIINTVRSSWSELLPGTNIEPLVADSLEQWVINSDDTIQRRYKRRIANLVDSAISIGDLAHVDDVKLGKPALFVQAIPTPPRDSRRLGDFKAHEELKRQKIRDYQSNGPFIKVIEMADTNHLVFIQRRDEVAREMRKFLLDRSL